MRYIYLESRSLQSQAFAFVEAKHEVHVLNCLPYCTLQQVVYAGNHEQLVFVFLYVNYGFVGVYDLLHVWAFRDEMREGCILIVVGIYALYLFEWEVALGICCDIDAACETSSLGDEEHSTIVARTKLLYCLVDFQQMLMREGLVYGDIVVAPGEVCCCAWLLTCACATRYAVDMDVATDDACLQSGQHGELYAGGKASGISKMLTAHD